MNMYPTILENPCEESRLQSYRGPKKHIQQLQLTDETLQSQCTSIQKMQYEPSRSISLVEQLKKELSSQKQCNLPRQIKSLFNESVSQQKNKHVHETVVEQSYCDKLTKKQYDDIMAGKRYDLPRSNHHGFQRQMKESQKSLKESIYERLMSAKREKQRQHQELKRQNVKEATFRPKSKEKVPLNKLKDIIKNKVSNNIISQKENSRHFKEFFLNLDLKADDQDEKKPQFKNHYRTKYETLLKENINTYNVTNKIVKHHRVEDITKQQSFMSSLKLREKKLETEQSVTSRQNDNRAMSEQNRDLARQRSLTMLSFQQRQNLLLKNKADKISRHEVEKKKQEMKGCTFKPRLTPYKSPYVELQKWNSYAELHHKKKHF